MRSATERACAVALVAAASLVACVSPAPSMNTATPIPSVAVPSAAASAHVSPSPTASTTAEPGIAVPAPGHPWDAAALLDAMRASTRPGGVPDELETRGLAPLIAAAIWTVDGSAWDTSTIGGYCGLSSCTLDIAGTHVDRAGEDLWTLQIELPGGSIVPLVADVRSISQDLVESLDRLTRGLVDPGALDAMMLTTARWLPPPAPAARFVLSYRSGGEEGSCAREITVDAGRAEVVEEKATGC